MYGESAEWSSHAAALTANNREILFLAPNMNALREAVDFLKLRRYSTSVFPMVCIVRFFLSVNMQKYSTVLSIIKTLLCAPRFSIQKCKNNNFGAHTNKYSMRALRETIFWDIHHRLCGLATHSRLKNGTEVEKAAKRLLTNDDASPIHNGELTCKVVSWAQAPCAPIMWNEPHVRLPAGASVNAFCLSR